MDDRSTAETAFCEALNRARGLCDLQQYLERSHTAALYTDDMLRAAVVMAVSAFDYLVHELYRVEAVICQRERRPIKGLELPLSVVHAESTDIEALVSSYIRKKNSHRTFVDPGKLAEAVSIFIDDPWTRIAAFCGNTPEEAKSRLRTIYRWRNRIAHEADINPEYAGATLWEIYYDDVCAVVDDMERLGRALVEVMRLPRV